MDLSVGANERLIANLILRSLKGSRLNWKKQELCDANQSKKAVLFYEDGFYISLQLLYGHCRITKYIVWYRQIFFTPFLGTMKYSLLQCYPRV